MLISYCSAILIRVATIGYGRDPDFDVLAPNQPAMSERIKYALRNDQRFINAFNEEKEVHRRRNKSSVSETNPRTVWTGRTARSRL